MKNVTSWKNALTVSHPAALRVAPGGAGVSPEHVSLRVLHHEDGGALVADAAGHLLQGPAVRLRGEEEPPVCSVLQQQVGVDEEDGCVIKTGAVVLRVTLISVFDVSIL